MPHESDGNLHLVGPRRLSQGETRQISCRSPALRGNMQAAREGWLSPKRTESVLRTRFRDSVSAGTLLAEHPQ